MADTKAFEGIIEDCAMKPIGNDKNRYTFKIGGVTWATFDDALGKEFLRYKGKKVKGVGYDTQKGDNLKRLTG